MVETNIANSQPVSDEYLEKMNAYWRAANYLGAAQLYLLDNPLLREPLTMEHVKKKIVGHWGTVPGQNFVYVHLNRVIKKYDQVVHKSTAGSLFICDRCCQIFEVVLIFGCLV